ncbi:MAG TPA: hypothetical protein VLT62_30960 [Candidatus Methylomirabilis sp.]|nr:hypothetical protein [Candidatus Methylomirabilis sp.]
MSRLEQQTEGMLHVNGKLPSAITLQRVEAGRREPPHIRQRGGSVQLGKALPDFPSVFRAPHPNALPFGAAGLLELARGEDYLHSQAVSRKKIN